MHASLTPGRWILLGMCLVAACLRPGYAATAERLAVTGDVANIRSGPAEKETVLWQVEKYYPLTVLEKKGDWFRIQDFEGDQGWIHKSLLGAIDTVIVKADQSNIRKGPGPNFEVAFKSGKGIPYKVLTVKGQWLEIQHADGDKGWIHKSLVW